MVNSLILIFEDSLFVCKFGSYRTRLIKKTCDIVKYVVAYAINLDRLLDVTVIGSQCSNAKNSSVIVRCEI